MKTVIIILGLVFMSVVMGRNNAPIVGQGHADTIVYQQVAQSWQESPFDLN